MTPTVGFLVFLIFTVLCLALAVITGLRAMRRWHFLCVGGALGGLYVAVRFAYDLGTVYDLEAAGWITPFHLTLAKISTAAYLLPLISGVRTIFVPSTRRWHRRLAFFVLGLTAASAVTGAWMLLASPLRAG